jgi:2-polyprenyl-3-methyl-5-hydroxy-6-metoxy-1,4-benzoquinol methylase
VRERVTGGITTFTTHPLILDAVPDGARRALDVGCDEGTLTRELRRRVPEVTGIDLDETSIELGDQLCRDRGPVLDGGEGDGRG